MKLENRLELDVIRAQMVRYCAFSLGQKEMETLQPSFDPLTIQRDHDRIQDALTCVIHDGPMPFAGLQDDDIYLENAKKGRVLTGQEIGIVVQQMKAIQGILAYEKALEVPHDHLLDLIQSLTVHPKTIAQCEKCIDAYGEVKDNASAELRQINASIRQVESEISDTVHAFLNKHATSIVDSIVTTRNERAVVLVKATEKNTFGGFVYGDSASGQASYVEPSSFIGPNNRKQELLSARQEEIHHILQICSKAIQEVAEEEQSNLQTCAILDALFAKAQWGKEHDAIVPTLTKEKCLKLKRARHPLIDPKKVVANDYSLIAPKNLLLITGPNTGGKTVSMKVIGLSVLMTYCGMPIPADEATIPFFDAVYADIGDDQSVVSSLSSFSAHISKLAEVIRQATADSLVLLDEIGSGTDPREGEAIAIAVLNTLRDRKTMCVATTHYNRLKAYGKRHDDVLVASVQFDMEKLVPTYKYLEGVTGQSNAFDVARSYGLPESILKVAQALKDQAKTQEDELIERLEKQVHENEREKERLERLRDKNIEEQQRLQKQAHKLEAEKDQWKQKAEQEANAYLEEVKEKADAILEEMRKQQSTAKYHEVLKLKQELPMDQELESDASFTDTDFKVGDVVELRSSGQLAKILKIQKKDIVISLNDREIHVSAERIRPSNRHFAQVQEKPTVAFQSSSVMDSMPLECNLIGKRVDEAMDLMDAYLDDVRLHHLKTFRIIHGDGSGALRKAVQKRLSTMKDVESYRVGIPQEGGTGATVVVMKG